MSDSVKPHRRQPTRPCHPWDSPGKNTGVGCHCLLQCVKVKSLSRVRLFTTPWTAAHQAPPSMGFSRQEYCSGVPLPSSSQGVERGLNYIIWFSRDAWTLDSNIFQQFDHPEHCCNSPPFLPSLISPLEI